MDCLEHLTVKTGQVAGGFQRVVELRGIGPRGTTEGDRHPLQDDVARQLGRPGRNQRMKITAVRTTVAEEFEHLDLRRVVGWLGR